MLEDELPLLETLAAEPSISQRQLAGRLAITRVCVAGTLL
jgi:hypothetical protein